MRFPRSQKLGRAAQFAAVRESGRRFDTGPYLVWFWHRPAEVEPALGERCRFAINASRRVGNAVVRNRLKRVLREAFRLQHEALPPRCDIWIQLKTGADALRPAELGRRLVEAGQRFTKQGNRKAAAKPRSPKDE